MVISHIWVHHVHGYITYMIQNMADIARFYIYDTKHGRHSAVLQQTRWRPGANLNPNLNPKLFTINPNPYSQTLNPIP